MAFLSRYRAKRGLSAASSSTGRDLSVSSCLRFSGLRKTSIRNGATRLNEKPHLAIDSLTIVAKSMTKARSDLPVERGALEFTCTAIDVFISGK